MTTCPSCGWADFCDPACRRTSPATKCAQRTAWSAEIMLLTSANDEQRAYWGAKLRGARKILGAAEEINVAAA